MKKKRVDPEVVHGYDLSLNQGAVVELVDGKLSWFSYYTNVAGVADRHANGRRVPAQGKLDVQAYRVLRLAWVEMWMEDVIATRSPRFVGVEDYALRAEHGAHQLGEAGGAARLLLWKRGIPFRLHDPIAVKMFATHDGGAQKDLVEEFVRDRWGADFGKINAPAKPGKKQARQSSEDLADAFAIAKLVDTERRIRAGTLRLSDLEHDKERQVFNRVTKSYPVSLIGRDWISNPLTVAFRYVSPILVRDRLKRAEEKARSKGRDDLANYLKKLLEGK